MRDSSPLVALVLTLGLSLSAPALAQQPEMLELEAAKRELQTGKDAYSKSEFRSAKESFQRAFEIYPDPIALYYLGLAELKLNECVAAERDLYRSLEDMDRLPMEALEGAREALTLAEQCKSAAATRSLTAGRSALAAGDLSAAVVEFEAAHIAGNNITTLTSLTYAYLANHDCDAARRTLHTALPMTKNPATEEPVKRLAREVRRVCHPDSDGDDIPDSSDDCPDEPGVATGARDGCPTETIKTRGQPRAEPDVSLTLPPSEPSGQVSVIRAVGIAVGALSLSTGTLLGVVAMTTRATTIDSMEQGRISETQAFAAQTNFNRMATWALISGSAGAAVLGIVWLTSDREGSPTAEISLAGPSRVAVTFSF